MNNKFRIGQKVRFSSPVVGRPGSTGIYDVTKVLPLERDEQQYRIKNSGEAHERVARESQLEKTD